ncbi:MAG TPA: hypothetical protein VM821_06005 [Abditibacteriaceae bacterium]|nr:hypothetical protein [Abditibacteriaceae bacterium]
MDVVTVIRNSDIEYSMSLLRRLWHAALQRGFEMSQLTAHGRERAYSKLHQSPLSSMRGWLAEFRVRR